MQVLAAVLHRCGIDGPYAETKPLHVDELELEGPGPGEALVEVAAAGLCHSDLSAINGVRPWPVPMVLGHEASGVVSEVGPGVSRVRPGDHVVFSYVPMCGQCRECQSGQPYLCEPGRAANRAGVLLGGRPRFRDHNGAPVHHHLGVAAFSTATVVSETSLVPIDRDFPLDKAALFGCAVLTGVGAVVNTARVEAGSAVAIWGMGGVGLSAVMGARLIGAWPVVAVDVAAHKLELARRVGATHTVDARSEDPVTAVRDLTGGGARYTFEAVGQPSVLEQAFAATRIGGTTVAIGLARPGSQVALPATNMVYEARQILGSYMGSAVPLRDVPRFMRLYRAGLLPVDALVTDVLSLTSVNEGFDALDRGVAARQLIRFR